MPYTVHMIPSLKVDLRELNLRSTTGDFVTAAEVSSDAKNPIAVVHTNNDVEGSSFDLRKALLLRKDHGFSRETLRLLAQIIKKAAAEPTQAPMVLHSV